MAKKIIKEPTIRRYKATYPICGCEFEFEFDTTDASWYKRVVNDNPNPNYWGINNTYHVVYDCEVVCPTCNFRLENMQTEIKE